MNTGQPSKNVCVRKPAIKNRNLYTLQDHIYTII